MWDRLAPEARAVMGRALGEADRFGHGYIGDEHILLGLLDMPGRPPGQAAAVLAEAGLDLAGARAELARLTAAGLTPQCRGDDAAALRTVGIDVDQVRARLSAAFGADAVGRAVCRASRRPWWRGGGRRRTPLCGRPMFAKRALALAADHADAANQPAIGPDHLLYGVLRDAADPYGAGLSRRGRRHLSQLGWTLSPVNPATAVLTAAGINPAQLATRLTAADR
jgi:ATP-dependent Clp protease ATP-binding subunit ClpA